MTVFSESDELIVPTSRGKLTAIAVGALVFVAVSAWMVFLGQRESLLLVVIGASSVVFFGSCGAYAIRRLIHPTPAVVIDRNGIVDNASALGVGFMSWDSIDGLREYRFKNQVFLGIVPKDLDSLIARQSLWKRWAIRANLSLGCDPVNIPQAMLPLRISALLDEIERRFRR
jgi:hypothetical protein